MAVDRKSVGRYRDAFRCLKRDFVYFNLSALKKNAFFQYLIKYNEIKTKKGIDLLQSLVEYYHAQTK